jgi:dATP pyrophosphohydrolase
LYRLQSMDTVPVISFQDRTHWPPDLYVIPQYAFAISVGSHEIVLSPEHTEARWARYETVRAQLWWQSNQTALWELHERLRHHDLPAPLREGYPR